MKLQVILTVILLATATCLVYYFSKEESPKARNDVLVIGFYLVANDKLREDILEDYNEIVRGSTNFSGICYVLVDLGDRIIFNRIDSGSVVNLSSTMHVPTLISKYTLRKFISTIYGSEAVNDFILILGGESNERNKLLYREREYMSIDDLNTAFSMVASDNNKFHISLLQIDMCKAINYDVLTAATPYCDFIIGSEIEIHSKGHKYDKELLIFNNYQNNKILTIERALDIFNSEHIYYKTNSQFSLISASKFLESKNDIASTLLILKDNQIIPQIRNASAINNDSNYLDLLLAFEELLKIGNDTIKERIQNITSSWSNIVIKICIMSVENSKLGGIGYYLPES